MISNATSTVLLPAGDGANLHIGASDSPATVELTSAEAWCELIRAVVALANNGGGHLDIRCISGDAASPTGRIFSAPIKSVDESPATETHPGAKSVGTTNLQPVRIVTDPDAPALQPQDVDRLYPWRQKDLLRELNNRLGRRILNSYDIQAVRRQHRLDEHPEFVFNLPGAGRRYSPVVTDWILEQHGRDPEFFHRARTADREIMKLRRLKPR